MPEFNLFNLVDEELKSVERELVYQTNSQVKIINEAATRLVGSGGKRIRPAFALLTAKFYHEDINSIIPLAVALELIHMATLVHDDVIDDSPLRRGAPTLKSTWGNRVSIYSGNYLFAKALFLAAGYERSDVLEVLADSSMKICEGEIIQMESCYNTNLGLKNYFRRIQRKTALLMSVSCCLGAMLSDANPRQILNHKRFGYCLGMAFQITDDILDFVADEKVLGKAAGSDVRQGIITLPTLYALHNAFYKDELAALLVSPDACKTKAETIIDMVLDSGGIDYSYEISEMYSHKAKEHLDKMADSPVKDSLTEIADFILQREF